jgi:hypothetical protein
MQDTKAAEDIFGDLAEAFNPLKNDTSVKDVVVDNSPSPTDPGWNDYVMGMFTDVELHDGRPTCFGLRRVAELVLGPILCSRPTQVFPPSTDDKIGRSTVVWEVTFKNGTSFSDVADCWEGNTDDAFCVFSTATAATRAEGRALRKALRLRTVAAEEVTKKDTASIVRSTKPETSEGEYDDSQRMTDPQANFIDVKARQLNINVPEFFKHAFKLQAGRRIIKKQASQAIEKLNEYQHSGNIPLEILGYEEWRS